MDTNTTPTNSCTGLSFTGKEFQFFTVNVPSVGAVAVIISEVTTSATVVRCRSFTEDNSIAMADGSKAGPFVGFAMVASRDFSSLSSEAHRGIIETSCAAGTIFMLV
ncbi:MAG: hypothetical protein LBB38_01730 [Puniceicoccales bacterium]|nr:hypothetical protein [Puniceicoccales bacterium]